MNAKVEDVDQMIDVLAALRACIRSRSEFDAEALRQELFAFAEKFNPYPEDERS